MARLGWRPQLALAEAVAWTVEWTQRVSSGQNPTIVTQEQIERFQASGSMMLDREAGAGPFPTIARHPSLVIVGYCAALTAFASIINRSWMFDPYGLVDQWAYFGLGHFFPDLRQVLPGQPSGDLLPVIWPSALFQSLLNPTTANAARDIVALLTTSLAIAVHAARATRPLVGLTIAGLVRVSGTS